MRKKKKKDKANKAIGIHSFFCACVIHNHNKLLPFPPWVKRPKKTIMFPKYEACVEKMKLDSVMNCD